MKPNFEVQEIKKKFPKCWEKFVEFSKVTDKDIMPGYEEMFSEMDKYLTGEVIASVDMQHSLDKVLEFFDGQNMQLCLEYHPFSGFEYEIASEYETHSKGFKTRKECEVAGCMEMFKILENKL